MTGRIRRGRGVSASCLTDDALAKTLTSTTTNLDAITGRMNRGEGTLGQLATNRELFNRLNSMTDRLDTVVAGLQQGQGTAGQLLQDKQLYENMNGTVVELRTTVVEVRKLVAAIQSGSEEVSEHPGESVLGLRAAARGAGPSGHVRGGTGHGQRSGITPGGSSWRSSRVRRSAQQWRCCLRQPPASRRASTWVSGRARDGSARRRRHGRGVSMLNRQRDNIATAFERVREQQRSQARASAHGGAGRVNDVFLGTIAAAVLVMAVIQVAAVCWPRAPRGASATRWRASSRTSGPSSPTCRRCRRTRRAPRRWQRPRSSGRTSCSTALRERIDETVQSVQETLLRPVRDAVAMLEALKDVFFGGRDRPRSADSRKRQPAEEEDALFIG